MTPLRKERERRGLAGVDVAAAVGMDQSMLSRIENGRRRASPELANRLAKYFGNAVTRDQILFPEDYAEDLASKKPTSAPALQKAS